MEGFAVSAVLIAILLGVLLVVVFDIFCLLRLWAAGTSYFLPKFVWAVLIVCTSPVGGLVYLLTQRRLKQSPELVNMRARPLLGGKAWFGPAAGRPGRSPASIEGHAVSVVAISATVYLFLAGQVLAAAVVLATLMIIMFLKATSPNSETVALYARDEPRARGDREREPAGLRTAAGPHRS